MQAIVAVAVHHGEQKALACCCRKQLGTNLSFLTPLKCGMHNYVWRTRHRCWETWRVAPILPGCRHNIARSPF